MGDYEGGREASPPSEAPFERLWRRFVSKIKSHFHERRAKRQKETSQDRFARRTANATAWIAALAVVGAGVGALQYFTFNDQLGAMRAQLDTMRLDQRPWVSLEVTLGGVFAYDNLGWETGHGATRWHGTVAYRLKNVGKTPATDVAFFARMYPVVTGVGGINPIQDLPSVCQFPEKLQALGMGWGEVIFPQEEWPEKTFPVSGDEGIFGRAKKATGPESGGTYTGQFFITACITYKPTEANLVEEPYRTGKAYIVAKKDGRINLDGETIDSANLAIGPYRHGAFAK